MGIVETLIALAVAAGVWFVWDSLKAREVANAAMRAACRAQGLLFLDDTVALRSIRPVRSDAGHLALCREYRFEYSDDGLDRRRGSVTLVGARLTALDLDLQGTPHATLH